jgi:hypothetical protein
MGLFINLYLHTILRSFYEQQTIRHSGHDRRSFLFIDYCIHGNNGGGDQFEHTSLSGILSIVYISAWMCSMVGLANIKATGTSKAAKTWLIIPLITLSIANIWNIWEVIEPGTNTFLYHLLDMFWPISNIFMFFFGMKVIVARQLDGCKRYVPLMVGLWLPFTILLNAIAGINFTIMMISGVYSAVNWMVLGYVVYSSPVAERLSYVPVRA